MSHQIIKRFKDEHYSVFFNPNTGFFARVEEPNYPEPSWSLHGPELLDISITNWCDKGCVLCYRKSDEGGHHMSLENYELVMKQAQKMHVFQVALGGGNPNQHPEFCEILRLTREEYGIVPNYTTNGRGLSEDVLIATKKYCGAVAVSAYSPYQETENAIDALTSKGIKTNIHFILTSQSVNTAIKWFRKPPSFLGKINALIFLNYKPVGRISSEKLLLKNSDKLEYFFKLATEEKHLYKIGFDTCTVTGIARYTKTPKISYEGCDAGRFSMFVSEDLKMYPCSFMVEAGYQGISMTETNMKDCWQNNPAFLQIRKKLSPGGGCGSCQTREMCLNGCPLFPQINLCPTDHNLVEVPVLSNIKV